MTSGRRSTVYLYGAKLDVCAEEVEVCRGLLNPLELARAERFSRPSLARRWLVSRSRLRQVLAHHCDVDPAEIEFRVQGRGKPTLDAARSAPVLHFNLSHSHDLAVVALTEAAPVGVDVEYERPISSWAGVAARFFSAREQAQLASVDEDRRRHAFYCCWTRKEAVIKATGEGLSARLDSFDVSLLPGASAAMLADRSGDHGDRWRLHHFEPRPGYVGALALRSSKPVDLIFYPDWLLEHA